MAPLVSVVMPVFNQERFIEEAIESVLAQTYADFELIVVDDGSTDSSAAKAERFKDVRVLRQKNSGASAARNTGVKAARGEWIAFCDSDDVQAPRRLAIQVAALEKAPWAAFVTCDFSDFVDGRIKHERALHERWLGPNRRAFRAELEEAFGASLSCAELELPVDSANADDRVYSGVVPRLFATIHFAWVGAMMIRRSVFEEAGGFDPSLTHYEDWDLGSRIAKRRAVMYVDVPLFRYRSHEGQLTKRTAAVHRAYLAVIERVWRADRAFYEANRELVDRALGSAHWQLGVAASEAGDRHTARACFARSVLAYPKQKRAYLDLLRALAH